MAAAAKEPRITDSDLLRLHLEGDHDAFATLVGRYQRELYNFLARFTGEGALAEDVFQETFLQLHVSAGKFDMSRRLKPWLFTIAANKARDAMRRSQRRRAAPLDATVGPAGDDAGTTFAELIPAEIPAPDQTIVNLETRRAVVSFVSEMPESLRVVLELCYFQQLSYKEVAEVLDVPLGTVKSRLHAAVRHFARKWKSAAERLGHGQRQD